MAASALLVFANNELAKRNALLSTRFPGADLVRLTCALCMPEAMAPYLGAPDELRKLLMHWGHDPDLVKDALTINARRRRLAATLDPDVVVRLTTPWTGHGEPPVLAVLRCGNLSAVSPDRLRAIVPSDYLVPTLATAGHLRTVPMEWIASNIVGERARVQALLVGKHIEGGRVSPQWVIDNFEDDGNKIMLLSRFRHGEVTAQHLVSCFGSFDDFVDAMTACSLDLDTESVLATWSQHYSKHGPAELARALVHFNNRNGEAAYNARALVDALEGCKASAVFDVVVSASAMMGVDELARPYVAQDGGDVTPAVVELALSDALSSRGWSQSDARCIATIMMSMA